MVMVCDSVFKDYRGQDENFVFDMQPCGRLKTPLDDECKNAEGSVCGYNSSFTPPLYMNALGIFAEPPQPVWTMLGRF